MIVEYKPSARSLERIPGRVVRFLNAYGTNRTIRNALISEGFTAEEQQRGWSLLKASSGGEHSSDPPLTEEEEEVRAASVALDQWDEPNFRKIKAILLYDHPDTLAYLFRGGLEAKQGPEAVLSVHTLAERVSAIEQNSDKERAPKNTQDKEALAKLARRGYTEKEWERLRALVATASKSLPTPDLAAEKEEQLLLEKAQLALYAWYREWSSIARGAIKRRDQLIALGLAKRRASSKAEDDDTDEIDDDNGD